MGVLSKDGSDGSEGSEGKEGTSDGAPIAMNVLEQVIIPCSVPNHEVYQVAKPALQIFNF